MTEEEKEAIETLSGLTVYYDDYSVLDDEEIEENDKINKSIELIINLVKKQQKEIEYKDQELLELMNSDKGKMKKELQLKDKVIDEMAYKLVHVNLDKNNPNYETLNNMINHDLDDKKEEIKQYFINKARRKNNK